MELYVLYVPIFLNPKELYNVLAIILSSVHDSVIIEHILGLPPETFLKIPLLVRYETSSFKNNFDSFNPLNFSYIQKECKLQEFSS